MQMWWDVLISQEYVELLHFKVVHLFENFAKMLHMPFYIKPTNV